VVIHQRTKVGFASQQSNVYVAKGLESNFGFKNRDKIWASLPYDFLNKHVYKTLFK